jgi:CheY-like chemotaxis protein
MGRQDVRVLVAAEKHPVRELLKRIVWAEKGAVVLGEAENVVGVVTLVRNTNPDIVLLDSCLPYVTRNNLPLSRVGGLDTAQIIGEQLSGTKAVLLTNLNSADTSTGLTGQLFRLIDGERVPCTLRSLYDAHELQYPVFADVESSRWIAATQGTLTHREMPYTKEATYFGGIGLVMGGVTLFTVVFAPVGVVIAAAGACALLFGLTGKLINHLVAKMYWTQKSGH